MAYPNIRTLSSIDPSFGPTMAKSNLENLSRSLSSYSKSTEQLGANCLVVHGDNRVILPAFPDGIVQCTISSPPYGDQKNYGSPDEIGSGNTDYLGYLEDLRRVVEQVFRVTAEGGVMWLVLDTLKRDGHSFPLPLQAATICSETGWTFQECVIWDKGRSLPWSHRGHFRGVFEYILLLSKGRIAHFDLDAVRDADHLSSYWVKYPERFHPLGKAPTDLWHFPIPVQGSWSKSDLRHLCPFPDALVTRMIALTTRPGDIVLDPFAGTGVVPAIASAMARNGVGIELSKRYFDAFVKKGFQRITTGSPSPQVRGTSAKRSLSELIGQLRAVKFPKTLFAQISRADRLAEKARASIAGFLVYPPEAGESGDEDPTLRLLILATSSSVCDELRNWTTQLSRIPPLSKFGFSPTISISPPKEWTSDSFATGERSKWYRYNAGRFNRFSQELSFHEFREALLGLKSGAKGRIPPIFSTVGVNVRPPVPD